MSRDLYLHALWSVSYTHLYEEKEKKFREAHLDFDIMLEQLFVNHVFYMGFPFVSGYGSGLDVYSAAVSLVTLYAVLKDVYKRQEPSCVPSSEPFRFRRGKRRCCLLYTSPVNRFVSCKTIPSERLRSAFFILFIFIPS